MSYLISDIKSDLQRKLHGTSLSKLSDVNSLIWEAGKEMIARIDPQEMIKIENIENAIYDSVFDYTAPDDLKGNKIIDIRPQVKRASNDNFSQTGKEEFDLKKKDNTFSIQWDNAVKTLRLSKQLTSPTTVNEMNDITSNGAWSLSGSASGLVKDNLNFISGGSSLKFDLAAAGGSTTGVIQNTTMTPVDLDELENVGALFHFIFFTTASPITSVKFDWGNDLTANFWSKTVTTPHNGTGFIDGWQLNRYDWKDATETGTVDNTAIDSLRATITYDGTATGAAQVVRMDSVTAQLGRIWEIVYYSKFPFRDTNGTFIERPTADTDIINLDDDSYNIMLYETARIAAIEIQGTDSRVDVIEYDKELYGDPSKRDRVGLYKQYAMSYPSETEKIRNTYYKMPPRTYEDGRRRLLS